MADAQKLMELLGSGGLARFVLITVGLMILIKLVDAVLEIAKKWRKTGSVEEQRRSCDTKFANDQRRLDALEAGQEVLVYGVSELLGHANHNGNAEEMIKAEQRLKRWLYER